ncbi:DUF2946 family protein [Rivibacter subsaxonicus]|uniref:DUF2946 family protein n=1 Tax=Rivibacter subsaxonicus TaxID=457575 RepID=A0A4Q7VWL6_9BURK|nr:DUF2946 family protein [Rivibacter subsaxonicus]RZU01142.1 DUF2946 family protein [Rivibacter subsaxonicus]
MDEIVKAALKKWPNVPACRGWLGLDARGDWYMRDDRVQAAGSFPQVKGSRLRHEKLCEFIHRNYEADADGCWYFQNGPQRVYVELEAAPLLVGVARRDDASFALETHTGLAVLQVQSSWLDEHGRLFLATERGFGLVRSLDMDTAADAVTLGLWTPQQMDFAQMPARFGYVLSPQRTGTGAPAV